MMSISWGGCTWAAVECGTMAAIISGCSSFISYGTPEPVPGTPCCDALNNLHVISDSVANKRSVCGCLMGLITTYYPHATALATLPGLCGVDLGFTIDPNTDCN
ncbi:putative non-specific lipid-transfer protein 14 [Carica papaya]|uniref:putative non-specific lipid-transfer protein 14 n=1 Tax=Carica papaya TaxID=3649 RepID=UPI000B8CC67C|nr:putative non-specific lipid-transfer protein 14 [Carica papaya]